VVGRALLAAHLRPRPQPRLTPCRRPGWLAWPPAPAGAGPGRRRGPVRQGRRCRRAGLDQPRHAGGQPQPSRPRRHTRLHPPPRPRLDSTPGLGPQPTRCSTLHREGAALLDDR
jgi:hypothetical protein